MSSKNFIRLDGVGKQYLKTSAEKNLLKAIDRAAATTGSSSEKWALKDINLQIEAGESIGVFGRNGAGKSTLLSLMAGTIDASAGTVSRQGRISPLLQLTAWIDKDISGRQNVEAFCALYGLRGRARRKLISEAEEFAGIGKFFDAPCRTYSSGMMARVAFSAALHLPTDFLIIDEVLAVGDASFREKCSAAFKRKIAEGAALVIVSQSPSALMTLAKRGIVLELGQVRYDGTVFGAAAEYNQILENKKRKKENISQINESDLIDITIKVQPDIFNLSIRVNDLPINKDVRLITRIQHHRGILVSELINQTKSNETGVANFDVEFLNRLAAGAYILDFDLYTQNEKIRSHPRGYRLDIVNDNEIVGLVDLSMNFKLT